MAYDRNNVFARILRGELPCAKVYEDEHVLAFRDIEPQAPNHVVLIPKGEYVAADDFSATASDAELAAFMRAIAKIAAQDAGEDVVAVVGHQSTVIARARRSNLPPPCPLCDAIASSRRSSQSRASGARPGPAGGTRRSAPGRPAARPTRRPSHCTPAPLAAGPRPHGSSRDGRRKSGCHRRAPARSSAATDRTTPRPGAAARARRGCRTAPAAHRALIGWRGDRRRPALPPRSGRAPARRRRD